MTRLGFARILGLVMRVVMVRITKLLLLLAFLQSNSAFASIWLVGTIAAASGGIATFRDEAGVTKAVAQGSVVDGWLLEAVEPGVATLRRGAVVRRVLVDGSLAGGIVPTGIERLGDEVVFSREARDLVAGEGLLATLMQAAATAVTDGYRISDIDAGSVYDLAGLVDGDVVTAIDGQPLDTPAAALAAVQAARSKDRFTIAVRRGSQTNVWAVVVR